MELLHDARADAAKVAQEADSSTTLDALLALTANEKAAILSVLAGGESPPVEARCQVRVRRVARSQRSVSPELVE